MTYCKGTDLNKKDQEYVLNAYIHRFTGERKPLWVKNKSYAHKTDKN